MDKVYLIERLEVDPLENTIDSALRWEVMGYVLSLSEAMAYRNTGGVWFPKDCWAINEPTNKVHYREIPLLEKIPKD